MERVRHKCAQCGRAGVPLIEWEPDPPRPDLILGPLPLICAGGCAPLPPVVCAAFKLAPEAPQRPNDAQAAMPPLLSVALLAALVAPEAPRPQPRQAPARCKWCGAGMPHDLANCAACGLGRSLGAGEVFYTVPWDPEADGAHVTGRVIRAVQLAAKLAIEAGWSAEALQRRALWNEPSLRGACVRLAVRWGMIP